MTTLEYGVKSVREGVMSACGPGRSHCGAGGDTRGGEGVLKDEERRLDVTMGGGSRERGRTDSKALWRDRNLMQKGGHTRGREGPVLETQETQTK